MASRRVSRIARPKNLYRKSPIFGPKLGHFLGHKKRRVSESGSQGVRESNFSKIVQNFPKFPKVSKKLKIIFFMASRGVRESGSWRVGESASQGVGESGSRGVGKSGSRQVGESGSPGVGESASLGVSRSNFLKILHEIFQLSMAIGR